MMVKNLLKKIGKSKHGFTLIELIVVVAIIAILAIILIPTIGNQITAANNSALKSDASAIFSASNLYVTDYINTNGSSPLSASQTAIASSTLTDMTGSKYFTSINFTGKGETFTVATDSDGAIVSVTVSKGSASATYPEAQSSSHA